LQSHSHFDEAVAFALFDLLGYPYASCLWIGNSKAMKKPRTTIISVELREDTQFNWNEKEKRFELLNSDGEISTKNLVSFGEGYARDKKPPKILRQLMSQIGGVIQPAAEENYADRYISIDTSYRSFGDNNLCVTAGMSTEKELDHKRGLLKGGL
jgi:hypothetical protein